MLTLQQILVPVNFSERSVNAAQQAALLATRFDARLILAHVIDRFPYEGTEMEIFYGENDEVITGKELDARFRSKLHAFSTRVTGDSSPQEILLKGDPAKEIVQFVQEQGIDLIVVPTHGYGQFRRFLLGSVTAKILHDTNCAVLTGTHGKEPPREPPQPYRRIGCAIDLSEQSESLLQWADDFARTWGAKLIVIHAMPLEQVGIDELYLATADWRKVAVRAAEAKVRELMTRLTCEAEICIDSGHPVHFVTAAAAEHKLDALVIGRGMAKRRGNRLPTRAYGIIRESPCPVVSVP